MLKIALFLIFFLLSCASENANIKFQRKSDFLYGEISRKQLYENYPKWKELEDVYLPDSSVISQINELNQSIEVIVFFGSWCGDSRRNVPKFLKVVYRNPNFNIKLWAVDRKKQIDNGFHEKYGIKRVPTFIFNYKGREIGRIVEYPENTIEMDILKILNKIN